MFAKLVLVILTAMLTADILLVVRQQRLDLSHEAATVHRRFQQQEAALRALQEQIAEACRPEAVRLALDGFDVEWVPIPADPAAATPEQLLSDGACGAPEVPAPSSDLGG
ncbi:MAG: hypothetical protein ACYTGC_02075 [Planctomycetota bacterium]